MNLYAIRRRQAWSGPAELEQAAARSTRVGNEEMPDRVRWIRTYVIQEEDGTLGSVCIYQATDPDAIEDHARSAGLRADEIRPVVKTVLVRADPAEVDSDAA